MDEFTDTEKYLSYGSFGNLLKKDLEKLFPNHDLTLNSKIIDIANHYNSFNNLDEEYAEIKKYAPEWKIALENWINKINNWFHKGSMTNAYIDIINGQNNSLYNYTSELYSDGTPSFLDKQLQQIGYEVALAYKFPKLKKELNDLQNDISQNKSEIQKINWKAGPAFFGYLIDELVRNGYLELPYDDNNKNSEYLLTIFNLQGTKNTLSIELSETTNNLTPDNKAKIIIKPNPKIKNKKD